MNTGNQQNTGISFNCLILFTILWPLLLGNFSKDNSFLQLHSVLISLEVLSAKYEYYLIFCRFHLLLVCIMGTIVLEILKQSMVHDPINHVPHMTQLLGISLQVYCTRKLMVGSQEDHGIHGIKKKKFMSQIISFNWAKKEMVKTSWKGVRGAKTREKGGMTDFLLLP